MSKQDLIDLVVEQPMDITAFITARRSERTASGLNVSTADGNVFSFATKESRDDFIRRATNAGRRPVIVSTTERG